MRKLSLNREPLAELLPADLAELGGGGPPTYNCFISYGERVCVPRTIGPDCLLSGAYPTLDCV